jgi:excisionase family DNA binding protein
MNLADAIRKAAGEGSLPPVGEVPGPLQPRSVEAEQIEVSVTKAAPATGQSQSTLPEPPNVALLGGNVVRIEMFMTAEQSTSMLRAIMTGQHTVLTLAEAAHYLRVKPQTIAKMAEDNELPCVEIDGKWRFLKHHLDEWLFAVIGQSDSEEENQDVA